MGRIKEQVDKWFRKQLGLSWCHGFVTEQLSHGEGVPGASCPCTGAAAAPSAISPLHPKGTLSLPHENSFPVVIFPVSIIIPLLELENKQLKEKGNKPKCSFSGSCSAKGMAVGRMGVYSSGGIIGVLRNYWCLQELVLPLFISAIVLWRAREGSAIHALEMSGWRMFSGGLCCISSLGGLSLSFFSPTLQCILLEGVFLRVSWVGGGVICAPSLRVEREQKAEPVGY